MNKQKIFEIAKVATASALSILLFSTVLRGVNQMVFAGATGTPTTIEQNTEAVSIPNYLPPMDINEIPELTIIESQWQSYAEISSLAMPRESAAQIGAEYIREMFGSCIDGMTVEMHYAQWASHSRSYWLGSVYVESVEDVRYARAQVEEWQRLLERAVDATGTIPDDSPVWERAPVWIQPIYSFTIDAVTGERIDIWRSLSQVNIMGSTEFRGVSVFDEHLRLRIMSVESELERTQFELYYQMAKEIAQKHFSNSTVVSIEFTSGTPIGAEFVDDSIVVTDYFLVFHITDDTGRVADVNMTTYSQELVSLSTQHNDIVPGFRHAREEESREDRSRW